MRYGGSRTSPTCDRGFTLIEALITLTIAALLLGVGVPGFRHAISSSRGGAAIMDVHALVATARHEAVGRNAEVTLCGTRDGIRCDRDFRGRSLVYFDRDQNRRYSDGDEMVAQNSLDMRGGRLRWRASGGRNYLRFRPDGSAKEIGTLIWCPKDNDARHARAIIISLTGRPRAARDRNSDGIREDAAGRPLTCDW